MEGWTQESRNWICVDTKLYFFSFFLCFSSFFQPPNPLLRKKPLLSRVAFVLQKRSLLIQMILQHMCVWIHVYVFTCTHVCLKG